MNKKIILCCVVVVLTMIICVVPSFATQGMFNVDSSMLTSYNDLMIGQNIGDFNCDVVYIPDVPFYDYNNSVSIDKVEISYTAEGEISALCYYGSDSINFIDSPDIEAHEGQVSYTIVSAEGAAVTQADVMVLFNRVFPDVPISVIEYTPIESVLTSFGAVLSWIPVAIVSLIGLFWTGSELTFLGILSVCGLAIAVFLLIFALIRKFMHFRG